MKKELIFIYLLLYMFSGIKTKESLDIKPLNTIGETINEAYIENNTYYFFSSVADVQVNEPIAYFISKQIAALNISYIFLGNDNYSDMNEDQIKNYTFNYTKSNMEGDNLFKIIFKTNENQKGLLLKMFTSEKKPPTSFTITRINFSIIQPPDKEIHIEHYSTQQVKKHYLIGSCFHHVLYS